MWKEARTPKASRLRQRKFALIQGLPKLADQLSGTITRSYTRCGKPTCRCANGRGHAAWSLTFMLHGRRHVERIPAEWAEEVEQRVAAGRELQDAVREVLAANIQLLLLAKQQEKKGKKRKK
ncbi:MAG: DUF6788 family protein [Candidatus Acidiferrum sp.]|jgi:hypothetical protein